MRRLQFDLRDMDKIIQGISKLCRLNIKLELKRAKDFYHKHIVKQHIFQTNDYNVFIFLKVGKQTIS